MNQSMNVMSTKESSRPLDRVWIAGSRSSYISVDVLDGILADEAICPKVVLHGGARGVDFSAGRWADARDVPVEVFPANWNLHGRAAGPLRNKQLAEHADCLVAILPAGPGTRSAIRCAEDAGIPVIRYTL